MLMLLRDTARRKQGNGASGNDSRREHLPPLPLDYRRGSAETESLSQDDRSANSSDPDGELNPAITTPTKLMRAGVTPQRITTSTAIFWSTTTYATLLRTPGTRAGFRSHDGQLGLRPESCWNDCLTRRKSIRLCVPSHIAYEVGAARQQTVRSPRTMDPHSQEWHRNREATVYLPA